MGTRGENTGKKFSWFWRWFLNSQMVTALLILLLLLLIIFLFNKISYVFTPVADFFSVVGIPVIFAGVFYYFLVPIVDRMERKGINRIVAIAIVFAAIIGILILVIALIVPKVQEQTTSFFRNLPRYFDILNRNATELLKEPIFRHIQPQIEKSLDDISATITSAIKMLSTNAFSAISRVVGAVANFFIAIVTIPFLLFYLLKDGKKIPPFIVKLLPNRWRTSTMRVMREMNSQVASYIRGQLTVAFAVAIMFTAGFGLIGLDYGVTLGILAGFLNLIPYLGSFLAMIPAVFLGIVAGPLMLFKIVIVFVLEQTIEGRVVSPLVLGSQLKIHPATILLVLLTAGKLMGLIGVILGIPLYAAIKVIVVNVFDWYRSVSSLYQEEEADSPHDEPAAEKKE